MCCGARCHAAGSWKCVLTRSHAKGRLRHDSELEQLAALFHRSPNACKALTTHNPAIRLQLLACENSSLHAVEDLSCGKASAGRGWARLATVVGASGAWGNGSPSGYRCRRVTSKAGRSGQLASLLQLPRSRSRLVRLVSESGQLSPPNRSGNLQAASRSSGSFHRLSSHETLRHSRISLSG